MSYGDPGNVFAPKKKSAREADARYQTCEVKRGRSIGRGGKQPQFRYYYVVSDRHCMNFIARRSLSRRLAPRKAVARPGLFCRTMDVMHRTTASESLSDSCRLNGRVQTLQGLRSSPLVQVVESLESPWPHNGYCQDFQKVVWLRAN